MVRSRSLHQDDGGGNVLEYTLLTALLVLVAVVVMTNFENEILTGFVRIQEKLNHNP